jgi:hypothetical protein
MFTQTNHLIEKLQCDAYVDYFLINAYNLLCKLLIYNNLSNPV